MHKLKYTINSIFVKAFNYIQNDLFQAYSIYNVF